MKTGIHHSIGVLLLVVLCSTICGAQLLGSLNIRMYGGIGLPVGDFGKTSDGNSGFAKTGLMAGGDLLIPLIPSIRWKLGGCVVLHSLDEGALQKEIGGGFRVTADGSYQGIAPLTGLEVHLKSPMGVAIYACPQIGLLLIKKPEWEASGGGIVLTESSASAAGFAYGIAGGIEIQDLIVLGGQFIAGTAKLDVTHSVDAFFSTTSIKETLDRKVNIIQIFVGLKF